MILKVISANSVEQSDLGPHCLKEQSELGPHCLPVCKNRFEKFARIFSRQHKQTTFSDACFLGILRVKVVTVIVLKSLTPTSLTKVACQMEMRPKK